LILNGKLKLKSKEDCVNFGKAMYNSEEMVSKFMKLYSE